MSKLKIILIILGILILTLLCSLYAKEQKTVCLKVKALAYCLTGRTSCGTRPSLGTIAVDPRVIPYGSKIYVPGYGWGKALDTGPAIKGNMIDVWFPTYHQCIKWGRRKLTIKVILP